MHLQRGKLGLTARAPWAVAFSFGLLHGFGFRGRIFRSRCSYAKGVRRRAWRLAPYAIGTLASFWHFDRLSSF